MAQPRRLLVVFHSRSGSTRVLVDDVVAGIDEADPDGDGVERRVVGAPEAGPDDVKWAEGLIIATPANFGYMSGLIKDFLERIYHPCLESTAGLPFGLVIKGDTDVDGALVSIRRIVAGLAWKEVVPPATVVGAITDAGRAACTELGATVAAGLLVGLY
jgi:NAD(P)H-dependent FMN reductase